MAAARAISSALICSWAVVPVFVVMNLASLAHASRACHVLRRGGAPQLIGTGGDRRAALLCRQKAAVPSGVPKPVGAS